MGQLVGIVAQQFAGEANRRFAGGGLVGQAVAERIVFGRTVFEREEIVRDGLAPVGDRAFGDAPRGGILHSHGSVPTVEMQIIRIEISDLP
ncbi:MAG: hypothetical protein MK010_08570 [Erythrobacter sp.]|nr:hypothetical protein [Erythrobacter sp.]